MPLVGYTCPPGAEVPGRQNALPVCLHECAMPCTTPPLLAAMWKADQTNHHVGNYISASMLTGSGCARQVMFERYHDFYEVPTKRYWPFRGTHAHAIVEGAQDILAEFGWLQEIRMSTALVYEEVDQPEFDDVGEWTGRFLKEPLTITLGGTCDAYNPIRKLLVDCKSMADKKVDMMITGKKGGTWSNQLEDSWVAQLNIYRYLIAHTPVAPEVREAFAGYGLPALPRKNYPVPSRLVIQGIGMMAHPVTGSRLAHKQYGKTTIHDIDAVPVWSLKETEAYIRPRALEWYRALVLKQIPPVVPKDKSWLCRSCAFNGSLCHPDAERAESSAT